MNNSYRTIFLSSALMGGQQVVHIAVGLVQAKAVAIILGSAGTGVFGIYASLLNLAQSLFGLGVSSSSIRHIAATQDPVKRSVEIRIVWKVSLWMALGASGILFVFRKSISQLTFNDPHSATDIGIIAASVGVAMLTTALHATLQGVRRIKDLTIANVISACLGAVTSILLIYFFELRGVAPAFLAACSWGLVVSWYFCRRLPEITSCSGAEGETLKTFYSLSSLGSAFMVTSLLAAASAYLIRLLVIRKLGIETAGLYQASWTLTTFYSVIILQALRVDFLPRLSAVSDQDTLVTRNVNEQTEVGVLIIIPGLLITLVAAPLLLRLLYTSEFIEASLAARWMLLGMIIRVGGWSLAYIPLVKNRPRITIFTEIFSTVILILFSIVGLEYGGLNGLGFAFFLSSPIYSLTQVVVARRLCRFRWTAQSLGVFMLLLLAAFLIFSLLMISTSKGVVILTWVAAAIVVIACLLQSLRLLTVMKK